MGTLRVLLIGVVVSTGCTSSQRLRRDAQCPCVSHQECSKDQSCIDQICQSPCPLLCGDNTICQGDDHISSCYCKPGYSGDPYIGCYDQYSMGNWPPSHATTKTIYCGTSHGVGTQFWISGADYSSQGHWTWMSTGQPFNFTDWSPGQPDNYQGVVGGEHCLELREDYQYLWNDGNCPQPHFPICEYFD